MSNGSLPLFPDKESYLKKIISFLLFLCLCVGLSAQDVINFADVGWDSIKINNKIVSIIAEEVFGYKTVETPGSTPIIHEALKSGEVDVVMEEWSDNIPTYVEDVARGEFTELGINFDDNVQGFFVPDYVKEALPNLESVQDLRDYADYFDHTIYGGIPGWQITKIMEKKVHYNGLDEMYEYVIPGSNAAMDSTVISKLDNKEPIVFYYWLPTYLMGKYDFTLLTDTPYDKNTYAEGIGALPAVKVTKAVSNEFYEENREFCTFLSKYALSSQEISSLLAYMQDNKADFSQAARYFLENNRDKVSTWLDPDEVKMLYQAIGESVKRGRAEGGFPFVLTINTELIDSAVRSFASLHKKGLSVITNGLGSLVSAIHHFLAVLPWYLLLSIVFFFGYWGRKKILTGLFFAFLVSLVGLFGLYAEMLETLSIVIGSVLISLLLGLPIGLLIASSKRANVIAKPIMDTMQTMPVFVYLIPALLLFGMGNASSIIATVIYAIVPIIRLTSLGILHVDKEVVEASKSFGASKLQTLVKVQIPHALPTIMTGVNQTIMMAVSMVVTCSMIGARGLGMEVLNAVNRIEIGRGLVSGSAVVILAILLDRITQSYVKKEN